MELILLSCCTLFRFPSRPPKVPATIASFLSSSTFTFTWLSKLCVASDSYGKPLLCSKLSAVVGTNPSPLFFLNGFCGGFPLLPLFYDLLPVEFCSFLSGLLTVVLLSDIGSSSLLKHWQLPIFILFN